MDPTTLQAAFCQVEAGQLEGIRLSPASLVLGTKTQMTTWQRWPAPSPRRGRSPDITGGLLLSAQHGEGGVPSGSRPLTAPGHHQHGPAGRNHRPGGARGVRGNAAQGVRSNLRHKTKNTSEMKCLRWQNPEIAKKTHSSGLYLPPAQLCTAPMYRVGFEEERMLMFIKCPTVCRLLCRDCFITLNAPVGDASLLPFCRVETEAQNGNTTEPSTAPAGDNWHNSSFRPRSPFSSS